MIEYSADKESLEFKTALKNKLPKIVIEKLADYERNKPVGKATVTEHRQHADRIID